MNNIIIRTAGTLVVVAATLSAIPTVFAQTAYVNTFDLSAKPATTGAYQGIDLTGVPVTMWDEFSAGEQTRFNTLIDTFNQGNPWKIKVTAISKGNYGQVYQAILGAIQTKSLPNISVAYGNQAATYQTAKVVLDSSTLLSDPVYGLGDTVKTDFIPGVLNTDLNPQYNGARLGFPEYRSGEVLYFNTDALKKLGYTAPPKTWDDSRRSSAPIRRRLAIRVTRSAPMRRGSRLPRSRRVGISTIKPPTCSPTTHLLHRLHRRSCRRCSSRAAPA